MRSSIFFYIEINGAIHHIAITSLDDRFDHADLFNNMASSSRLNRRRQCIKLLHRPVKQVGVFLHQFHRFQLFQHGFF